jgi:hypothetical protein
VSCELRVTEGRKEERKGGREEGGDGDERVALASQFLHAC